MWKYFVILSLALVIYFVPKQPVSDFANSFISAHKIDENQVNAILKDGYDEVVKAVALRNKLKKAGVDYNKAANIPELESQLPILTKYYRQAINNQPEKQLQLEKIIQQIKYEFEKKSMTLWKWGLFHKQLNVLMTDKNELPEKMSHQYTNWGKLDLKKTEKDKPFRAKVDSFPWFIYVRDGILGLQTLNYAFINDIMPLGMATDTELEADGLYYTPLNFTGHDVAHFISFRKSEYMFKRFRGQLIDLYNKIENQPGAIDRLRDHFVLFMLIHEFPYSSRYPENFNDVLRAGARNMKQTFEYFACKNAPTLKTVVKNAIGFSLFSHETIKIKKLSEGRYEVNGYLEKTQMPYTLIATLTKSIKDYKVTYKDPEGKNITKKILIKGAFMDLTPLLEIIGSKPSRKWNGEELTSRVMALADKFINKYAN